MRRLSGLVLILMTVSLLVVLASRWIGSLQPLPTLAGNLFTDRDGQPCYIPCVLGIRADQSNIFATLKAHPALKGVDSYSRGNDLIKTVGYETTKIRIQANEYEHWLSVALQPPQPSLVRIPTVTTQALEGVVYLGDLVKILGPPDFIQPQYVSFAPEWATNVHFLKSPYILSATVYSRGPRLNLKARLSYLIVYLAADTTTDFSNFQPWMGFASVERYGQY